ncbi:MAG: hypothetical protein J6K95_07695 [Rikenellaceae bacterium]|nr:hypothetical protein [Rikenellaceae bacterium]
MGIRESLRKSPALVKAVRKWRNFVTTHKGVNWNKTLYLNFKTQRFADAVKLPILVYGKLKIPNLSGKIVIEGPVYHGKIKLGFNSEYFSASRGSAILMVSGQLIFHGRFRSSVDCMIDAAGVLEFDDLCFVGNAVKVSCKNHISLGRASRLGVESQVFDSNFHYVRDVETGVVRKKSAPIVIGRFCWIGNRATLMKGTRLPDYSIVAGNSMCNKDYTVDAPAYPCFAGSPAKAVGKGGGLRIFDIEEEARIDAFFAANPQAATCTSYTGVIDETDLIGKYF